MKNVIKDLHQVVVIDVTCAKGVEELLSAELNTIFNLENDNLLAEDGKGNTSVSKEHSNENIKIEMKTACVRVHGSILIAYQICLWSRLAEQVLLNIVECELNEAKDLYEHAMSFAWESLFSFNETFKIESRARDSELFRDNRYASLLVKDAIADRFRENYDKRPSVDSKSPDIYINVFIDGSYASVSLNLSGEKLHKRGYRKFQVDAPIKENLAAALLMQMGWQHEHQNRHFFIDPFCGSATIVIEALLIAADIAPGSFRSGFAFKKYRFHDETQWQCLLTNADTRKQEGLLALKSRDLKFYAYDASPEAVAASLKNIESVGLEKYIHVERKTLAFLERPSQQSLKVNGYIVSNPPYGERLDDKDELKFLYQFLGLRLKSLFGGSRIGFINNQVELLDILKLKQYEQARFFNGNLPCIFRYADIEASSEMLVEKNAFSYLQVNHELADLTSDAEALANRLKKNLKSRSNWIKKNNITCFRLYDADIPEFNAAIDCYQSWLHVAEYKAPKQVDEEKARRRFQVLLATLRDVFSLQRDQIFVKSRAPQKGNTQYKKHGGNVSAKSENKPAKKNAKLNLVQENGHNFLLNLGEYLDTGLFLDHRIVRKMIEEKSKNKRFLNLYSYTGSATVYAAKGGAKSSVSVDLSSTYLEWMRKNLMLNGFSLNNHISVKDDALTWLKTCSQQFDLIFVDPPTFSNSKKKNLVFDIQKDHLALIDLAVKRLDEDGLVIFSNNFRKFKMDPSVMEKYDVKDMTRLTTSPDFSRAKNMHQSWFIQKRKN